MRESLTDYVDHERYYEGLLDAGYGFGPNFRQIQNVWSEGHEALAEIEIPEELRLQRIEDTCLMTEECRNILPPGELAKHLDGLHEEGHDLLDGLGFN